MIGYVRRIQHNSRGLLLLCCFSFERRGLDQLSDEARHFTNLNGNYYPGRSIQVSTKDYDMAFWCNSNAKSGMSPHY